MPIIQAPDQPEFHDLDTTVLLRSILETGDADLAQRAWDAIGENAFRLFVPLHRDMAYRWRDTNLSSNDIRTIFGYQLRSCYGVFKADRQSALSYAYETRRPEIIEVVLEELAPTPVEIARSLGSGPGINLTSTPELASTISSLVAASQGEEEIWRGNVGFYLYRNNREWLLLLAKRGLNMTGYAQALTAHCSNTYAPYLRTVGSQHGRLRLMQELPNVRAILSAHARFIEDLILDIENPIAR
jgi:hypothetical protein